jgi:hypothetical protein
MKYTIQHGSIAAIQYVTDETGARTTVVGETSEGQPEFDRLPLAVRAAVNRQFGSIFSLPVARRQAFIDASVPFTVEAA